MYEYVLAKYVANMYSECTSQIINDSLSCKVQKDTILRQKNGKQSKKTKKTY
jgi:hypothetical protein